MLFRATMLGLLLTVAAGAMETTPEAAAFFNDGVAQANAGKFDEAIKAFEKSLVQDPGLSVAHEWIAHCLIMQGDNEGAIKRYQLIAAQNPSTESKVSLGLAYLRVGDVAMAEKTLENAVAADPKSVNGWNNLALAYLRGGKTAPARTAVEKALSLEPSNAPALVTSGNVSLKEGQAEAAITSFDDALQSDRAQVDAYYGLGEANAFLGREKVAGDNYILYLGKGGNDATRRSAAVAWLWDHGRGAEVPK